MDISSEIVHALLPLFLTATLGVSVALVGLIDGVAESTASIVKVFSGFVSDRWRRRKPLILLGYGLGALSKPMFPLAAGVPLVLAARFVDRIGKGLRGAPRDALVADVTPESDRGRAYGLRQALDTVGGFIGPLLAIALMLLLAGDIRAVLWLAVVPAAIAIVIVVIGVDDGPDRRESAQRREPIRLTEVARLSRGFWTVVAVGVVFHLARFSEAFLILKASAVGLPDSLAPLVLMAMTFVYAAGAYPAGALADVMDARKLLSLGLVSLIAADLALALSSSIAGAFIGVALWGLHMALTQGLLAKLVAEQAPERLRGSAFGVFNLVTGATLFFASVGAGLLWHYFSPAATFFAGAGFAAVAGLMMFGWRRQGIPERRA